MGWDSEDSGLEDWAKNGLGFCDLGRGGARVSITPRPASAPCCSFRRRAFLWPFSLVFSLLLRAFLVPLWPWVLGAVLFFLPSGFFVAVLACVFSSFAVFFFFKKAILLFLMFWFFS